MATLRRQVAEMRLRAHEDATALEDAERRARQYQAEREEVLHAGGSSSVSFQTGSGGDSWQLEREQLLQEVEELSTTIATEQEQRIQDLEAAERDLDSLRKRRQGEIDSLQRELSASKGECEVLRRRVELATTVERSTERSSSVSASERAESAWRPSSGHREAVTFQTSGRTAVTAGGELAFVTSERGSASGVVSGRSASLSSHASSHTSPERSAPPDRATVLSSERSEVGWNDVITKLNDNRPSQQKSVDYSDHDRLLKEAAEFNLSMPRR